MPGRSRTPAPTTGAPTAPDVGPAPDATDQSLLGNAAIAEQLTAAGEAEDPYEGASGYLGVMADADADAGDRALAAFNRGVMLERAGDLHDAVLAYEEAWASGGDAQVSAAAGEKLDRLRPRLRTIGADQADADMQGGVELFEARRYAEAIEVWELCQVHTRGNDPAVQFDLARAYEEVGRTQEAIAMLAILQDRRGLPAEIGTEIGKVLARLRGGGGPPQLGTEAPVAPTDTAAFDAMEERAADAVQHGHLGEAASLYLTLLESPVVGPDRGAILFNLGVVWSRLGMQSRAREAWQGAIDSHQLDRAGEALAQERLARISPPQG